MWTSIPAPRRVLFDLSEVTEVEPEGLSALIDMCSGDTIENKASIFVNNDFFQTNPRAAIIFPSKTEALQALGDVSDTPIWMTRVRTDNETRPISKSTS